MSRTFWVLVGAVGGIYAYRRGARAVARARELGPMGTAQVAAQATSTLAGHAADGLGRLQEIKARRAGRVVAGSLPVAASPPPEGWVAVPERGGPAAGMGRLTETTTAPPLPDPPEEERR